jgi:hypothetical protein
LFQRACTVLSDRENRRPRCRNQIIR